MAQHSSTTPTGVELHGVHKSFGPVAAVRGIDLTIQAGETVALLGPNGAGKSTTLDMVLGLLPPDAGSVALAGRAPVEAVAGGHVAAMLQSGGIVRDLTVREIVAVVGSLYPRSLDVDLVLEMTELRPLAGRMTQRLSGGQVQRVRFALALVANADLLVLDEPTAALDVEARQSFWAVVRSLVDDGKTVVFATHYLEEADAQADRIVLMKDGTIAADGSATEITSRVRVRTIRATLPDVPVAELLSIRGVQDVERHGDTVILTCDAADQALRTLLDRYPSAADIEVRGGGLEEAFLALTSPRDTRSHEPSATRALADQEAI